MKLKFNKDKSLEKIQVVNKHTAPWLTLLTIFFIVLKVLGIGIVANWSWWWVFSPVWIPFAALIGIVVAFFALLGVIFIFVFLYYWIQAIRKKRKLKKQLEQALINKMDLWSGQGRVK